jgi:hypothetical protein
MMESFSLVVYLARMPERLVVQGSKESSMSSSTILEAPDVVSASERVKAAEIESSTALAVADALAAANGLLDESDEVEAPSGSSSFTMDAPSGSSSIVLPPSGSAITAATGAAAEAAKTVPVRCQALDHTLTHDRSIA